MIEKVFAQNHINASYFEIVLIVSFILIGLFRDTPILNIPAGASIFLLFTLLIMLFSVFYSWFKGWTLTMLIVAVLGFNYLSNHFHLFHKVDLPVDSLIYFFDLKILQMKLLLFQ